MKYTFGTEVKTLADGREVRRIFAARDFGIIKKWDRGGFIEDTRNLSSRGNCWVANNAIAAGQSRVTGNAILRGNAFADEYAKVTDDAIVCGNAKLLGDCFVYGQAHVGASTVLSGACTICGNATVRCQTRRSLSGKNVLPNVSGVAVVRENAVLEGKARLFDRCIVEGNATVRDNARVAEDAHVWGFAIVESMVSVSGNARIAGRAKIGGRSQIRENAIVHGNAVIRGKSLVLCNAYVFGKAVLENAILSGDETCNFENIKKRRLKPHTTTCEPKKEIPASSRRPEAAKAP